MTWQVLLTDDAALDLESIYHYIATHDSPSRADYVLDAIEKTFSSLSENPERGSFPQELLKLGNKDFREIYFKPYRIVYTITDNHVIVYLIADGRRDFRSLLETRLLRR